MKTPSKEADVEEELQKEPEEELEEELPIEEAEAQEELEEIEERAEEEITEEEVLEEPIEEPIEEEEAEEERPERREREEIEEEIVEERIYTIPLGRAWISPPKKRAPRAIRIVKSFITRHMKIKADVIEEAERLVISNEVNEKIWSSGIKNPPRKIRVRAVKDKEGTVTLHLAEGD